MEELVIFPCWLGKSGRELEEGVFPHSTMETGEISLSVHRVPF